MARCHLAGFFENQDGAGALQNLAALVDPLSPQVFPAEAGDFLLTDPRLPFIAGVYASVEATVQPRARLVAPSFRSTYGKTGYELPVLSSSIEPAVPAAFNDYRAHPIKLGKVAERLSAETLNNPGAATDQYVLCWFTDGPVQPVSPEGGAWYRFITAASAMTADTWNTRALTPEETLEAGTYEVLGMRAISTSCIAARLACPGTDLRPGVLGADTRTDAINPAFQPGQFGVLGEFTDRNLPSAEFLVDAADNEVQVVDLYLRPKSGRGSR